MTGIPSVHSATLAPLLAVRDGARAIDFYKKAFSATEIFRIDSDDGAVVAHLAVGASDFWLADESPASQNYSPESLGGSTVRMVMVVDDPDAIFNQAIVAGASPVAPVVDQPYRWRIGRLVDPFGHHWEIGKPLD